MSKLVTVFGWAIFVALGLHAFPMHAWAQVNTTATLSGTVTDPVGALVPGAHVIAESVATKLPYEGVTDATGTYRLLNLPPGAYNLSVTASGFQKVLQNNITLTVSQSSTQNFSLQVGAVSQTVEVRGAPPLLQTGTASLGTIINSRQVVDLPLNGRQFTELILLTPGASPIDQKQDTIPGIGSHTSQLSGNTVIPSVNGRPTRTNLFYVDGIIDAETFFSGFSISPSVDIIQEFNVESHNDNAQVGLVAGGVINVATKSGTDALHGDVFEFNRNKAVEARNFFDPNTRPNFNQNQFGFTLGGRIPKVKNLWFFGGYEGFRFVRGSSILSRVPTPAERGGDFSSWLGPQLGTDALGRPVFTRQIFNPYTGRNVTAGQVDPLTGLVAVSTGFVREPFPGNIINPATLPAGPNGSPAGKFNPLLAWLKWVPQPNLTTNLGTFDPNFINTQSSKLSTDQFDIRLDRRFSLNDTVYGRYLFLNTPSFGPADLPTVPTVGRRDVRNVGIHWIHNFGPSLIVDLTAGFQQARNPGFVQQPSDKEQLFSQAGFGVPGGAFFLGAGNLMHQFPGVSTDMGGTGSSSGSNLDPERIQQYAGDVTKILGRHTLKAGAVFFHSHSDAINGCPSVSFSNVQTADPTNRNLTGLGFASFLLGDPSGGLVYAGDQGTVMDMSIFGFYGQDSFRVTPKLTINYGVRWDHTTPPVEKSGHLSGFDWDTGKFVIYSEKLPPDCALTGTAPCIPGGTLPANVVLAGKRNDVDPVYDNFQPRLGFAYQLNNRTVIRAGAGTNFDNWAFILQNAQDLRGAWPFGLIRAPGGDLNQTFFTNDAQHLVSGAGVIPPPTPFPAGSRVNSSHAKNAYVTGWNLDVQRQLTDSLTVTGAYVGSKGSRTYTGFLQNFALTPGAGPINARAPFQLLGSPAFGGRTIGSSWYTAFQFKLEQRLNHGVSYLLAYTWSKSEDTGCSGFAGIEGCAIQDPYNIRAQKSVSNYDLPQNFVFSYIWQLPFGKGRPFLNRGDVLSKLAGDWQVNGVLEYYSGQPVTANQGSDTANTGNFQFLRPDQIGNPIPSQRDRLHWFDPNAFRFAPDCRLVPASECRFGTLGRNTLRGPHFGNWDFSLFRDFPINERVGKIQFRAEFFNLFNNVNFTINPLFLSLSSSTFGQLLSAAPSRQIQFAGKWIF